MALGKVDIQRYWLNMHILGYIEGLRGDWVLGCINAITNKTIRKSTIRHVYQYQSL